MFGSQPWGSVPWAAEPALDTSILANAVESLTAAESSNRVATMSRAQAEAVAATHTQNAIDLAARAEAASATEASSVFRMYAWRFQDEPATATDTETVTMIVARAEPATATHTQDALQLIPRSQADAASASDSPNRTMSASGSQTEAASANHTQNAIDLAAVAEDGDATDAPNRTMSATRAQAEAAVAAESSNRVMSSVASGDEDAIALDSSDSDMSAARSQADVAAATDIPNRTMAASRAQTEAGAAADTTNRAMTAPVSATDTSTPSDTVSTIAQAAVYEYATRLEAPGYYPDVTQEALWFDGTNTGGVAIPNDASLQLTGDMTLVMRLRPLAFNARRNPIDKAYGGEFTVTQETNGTLVFFWGTAGTNSAPYSGVASAVLRLDKWNICVFRRKLGVGGFTQWTINGVDGAALAPAYAAATASTNSVTLGSGYAGRYLGGMDDFRLYNRSVTDQEVDDLSNSVDIDPTGLVGSWSFDEDTDALIPDTSGSGNDGTLSGVGGWRGHLYPHTRGSIGTYLDAAGNLQTAVVNAPRFDHDYTTLSAEGLLIEGQATNYVRQSQALNVSPWSGSASATLDAALFCGTVPFYVIQKAVSTANEVRAQTLKAVALNDALTVTVALLAGTSNKISVGLYDTTGGTNWGPNVNASGVVLAGPGTIVQVAGGYHHVNNLSTTIPTIVAITRTYQAAGTAGIYLYPDTAPSTVLGANNKVTRVQVEDGTDWSSYIPTTTVAVTRLADVGYVATGIDTPSSTMVADGARAENATATDTPNRTMAATASRTDSVTALETQNRTATLARTQSEANSADDEPSVLQMYAWRFMDEPASALDTESVITVVARSDSTPVTDAANRSVTMPVTRTDATPVSETQNRVAGMARTQVEAATAVDVESGTQHAETTVVEYIPDKLLVGSYALTAGDLLAFERDSVATYFDGTGDIQTALANVPRFQGGLLLIEAEATNSLRNNTMAGAVAGTPGTKPDNWVLNLGTVNGVAIRISAVGTENGIDYIDYELSGTCTTSVNLFPQFDVLTLQPAAVGEQWVASVYTKMVSGSIPSGSQPVLNVSGRLAGGASNENSGVNLNNGTGALSAQRVSASRTLNTAGTVTVGTFLTIPLVNGQTYMYTLRIGSAQLERGLTATSLIKTSSAMVTRNADDAWPWPEDAEDRAMTAPVTVGEAASASHTQNAIDLASQTETSTATETQNAIDVAGRTDTSTATDTSNRVAGLQVTRTDSTPVSETQAVSAASNRVMAEPMSATDTSNRLMSSAASQTEAGNATDTENHQTSMQVSRTDSVSPTETSNAAAMKPADGADTSTAIDTPNRTMAANASQSDGAAATETQNETTASSQSMVEPTTGTAEQNAGTLVEADWYDLIGVTDTSHRALVTPVNDTESGNATDTPSKTITATVSRTDAVTPTETQSTTAFNAATRTENETLIDTPSQNTSQSVSRTDTSPATDTNVGNTLAEVERHDTGTATDTSNRLEGISRQQSEPAQAQDVPSTTSLNVVHESTVPTDQYFKHMLAEVGVQESTTPSHTQSVASLFNRWLQEDTVAIDTQSVLAFMQALQVDEASALDKATVVDFTVGVSVQETTVPTDVTNGVVVKITNVLENTNASDVQAASATMVRIVQELNPALDVAAAVAHAQVVVAEGANATDWCAIVIPVGQHDGTDATDTCAVFLYQTNRMLLLFDKDCHC